MDDITLSFPYSPPLYLWRQGLLNCRYAEGGEDDIDDAVRAKDDDEPDEPPHNRASALLALRLVARMRDKFKYAPEKDDERHPRKQQYERIDDLRNNLPEKGVECGH